jgi:hypothetical protein
MIMGVAMLSLSNAMALCSPPNSDGEKPATAKTTISQQMCRAAELDRFILRTFRIDQSLSSKKALLTAQSRSQAGSNVRLQIAAIVPT